MKKLLIAAVLTALPFTAQAQPNDGHCPAMYSLSEAIMKARHNGVPMPKVMQTAGQTDYLRLLITEAYEKPRLSTPEYVEEEVAEFANKAYRECLEVL